MDKFGTVPPQFVPYIQEASQGTGIPFNVVAQQAFAESSFNPNSASGAGALGFWEFEPATFNSVAAKAGVPPNTELNIANETKAYVVFMNELLQQEGGSVFKALEAYNAGPGNLPAGAGYASGILSAAGASQNLTVKGGVANAQTTAADFHIPNPFNIGGDINNALGGAITSAGNSIISAIFSALGIPSLKDLLQRLGLILLGVALVLVGLTMVTKVQVGPAKIGGNSGAPPPKQESGEVE